MNFFERSKEIDKMNCSSSEKFKLRVKAMYEAETEPEANTGKMYSIKSQLDVIGRMDCTAMEKAKRKAALLFAMMPTEYRRR